MTGLELLKAELLSRGFTKAQVESKTLIGVLEVLSRSNGRYSDMNQLEMELKTLRESVQSAQETYIAYKNKVDELRSKLNEIIKEVNDEADKRYKATSEYVGKFFTALEECETAEARDALKAAQMFVNTVKVDTKYDNTAFIIGLSSILAHGKVASIDELRKINSEIPKIRFYTDAGFIGPGLKGYEIISGKRRLG